MAGNLVSHPILGSKAEKLRDVGVECAAESKVDENLLV